MITINPKSIKKWNRIGQRATFGLTMIELAKQRDDLIVITADVSTSAGLDRFRSAYPEQFYDMGISEQNMIGVATGLASMGNCVFTTTFAPFQTMRCLEQIRVNLGYMKTKVCMVGLASGIYHIYLGNTHCCIEDFGVLRSIPNMTILSPADGAAVVKCLEAASDWEGPVYIRLSGGNPLTIVYKEDFSFEIGKGIVLKEGKDVALISTGTMTARALEVAGILYKEGVSCSVIDMHTIKPLDINLMRQYIASKLIVSMEEHNIIGGLGSAIAEYLSENRYSGSFLRLGVNDFYPHGTDYDIVMDQCGLSVDKMVRKILEYRAAPNSY
jgi:transketolase